MLKYLLHVVISNFFDRLILVEIYGDELKYE